MEYAALGFSPLVHPLELFGAAQEPAARPAGGSALARVRGLVAAMRHYHDKRTSLWFISLDSPDGMQEGIVPEGVAAPRLEIGDACEAEGAFQRRFGVATLKVRSIRRLAERPS